MAVSDKTNTRHVCFLAVPIAAGIGIDVSVLVRHSWQTNSWVDGDEQTTRVVYYVTMRHRKNRIRFMLMSRLN